MGEYKQGVIESVSVGDSRRGIKIDGEWYGTFKKPHFAFCVEGADVSVEWYQKGDYKNITSIEPVGGGAIPHPPHTDPDAGAVPSSQRAKASLTDVSIVRQVCIYAAERQVTEHTDKAKVETAFEIANRTILVASVFENWILRGMALPAGLELDTDDQVPF